MSRFNSQYPKLILLISVMTGRGPSGSYVNGRPRARSPSPVRKKKRKHKTIYNYANQPTVHGSSISRRPRAGHPAPKHPPLPKPTVFDRITRAVPPPPVIDKRPPPPKPDAAEDTEDEKPPVIPRTKRPKKKSGGRTKNLIGQLRAKGAKTPGALAAWIGRQKYGDAEMEEMAQEGKAKKRRKRR